MIATLANLHIAIYARYSSDRQRKASIDDQIRRCTEWIVAHGGTVDPALVFRDEAVSGKSLVRDGFEHLMSHVFAKPRRVDVIVVEDISRMSRDLADSADIFRRLQFVGVQFISVADGIDTNAKGAKLGFTIKSLMADFYLEDLRDKTLRGLEGRMLAGFSTGGLPLGYRSVAVTGEDGKIVGYKIEIDEERARIVVRIFRDYMSGHSLSAIARAINGEGVPPPRAHTKHRRKGWVAGTIRAILHNKKYRGTWAFKERRWVTEPGTGKRQPQMRLDADIIKSNRPELRIVDEETWLSVEARLKAVHTHYTRNEDGSPKGRSISGGSASYLFSGILTCEACEAPMVIYGGKEGSRYYRCGDNIKRGTCKVAGGFREEVAKGILLQAIRDQLASPWGLAYARKLVAECLGGQTATRERARSDRHGRLARTEARINKLIEEIADGLKSKYVEAKLRDLEAQAEDERHGLVELDRQDQIPIRLPSPREIERRVFDLYENLSGDPAEGRETLRRLFKDGKVHVRRGPDGVFIAKTELLPLAIVLAESAIAAPGGSPGAAIYGESSGGSIRALYNSVTLPLEVRLAA